MTTAPCSFMPLMTVRRMFGTMLFRSRSSPVIPPVLSPGPSFTFVRTFQSSATMLNAAGSRLQKLAKLAAPRRIKVVERVNLDDWVHDSGSMLLVGDAAHPFPVRALQLDLSIVCCPFTDMKNGHPCASSQGPFKHWLCPLKTPLC